MNRERFFDDEYIESEQLPKKFSITFEEVGGVNKGKVKVLLNDAIQLGDVITDNAHKEDYYRYHDIFHYSFATLLGWSPCARKMMKLKRKSDTQIDEIEDGARAAITEEALSMIIFNEAKRKNFFAGVNKVSKTTLRIIKEMTENFEAHVRTAEDWQSAILSSYAVFRELIANDGGRIQFDAYNRTITYSKIKV